MLKKKQITDLHKTIDCYFPKKWLNWINNSSLLKDAIDSDYYQSGGNNYHLFFLMSDKRIISMHESTNAIELSYKQWGSIDQYINVDYNLQDGFGYETNYPLSEKRSLDATKRNYIKILKYYNDTNNIDFWANQLAKQFTRIINEWLTIAELKEVRKFNSLPENIDYCGTHNFCDGNQALIDAYQFIFNCQPDITNNYCLRLSNKAWGIAKQNQFLNSKF